MKGRENEIEFSTEIACETGPIPPRPDAFQPEISAANGSLDRLGQHVHVVVNWIIFGRQMLVVSSSTSVPEGSIHSGGTDRRAANALGWMERAGFLCSTI